MKHTCALLRPRRTPVVSAAAAATVTVPVSPDATVSDFTTTILTAPEARPDGDDATLALYLTPIASHKHQQGTWLPRTKLALLDAALVEAHGVRLDPESTLPLSQWHGFLGGDFEWREEDIHVVAVVKDHAPPPAKKARMARAQGYITRPRLLLDNYSVPLDTIDTFRAVQAALTLREHKAMMLICGPPVSGKTQIANSVYDWVDAHWSVSVDVHTHHLVNDASTWTVFGKCVDRDVECTDKASFVRACADLPTLWFLFVDNLHLLLAKPDLKSQFLDALRELRELPAFGVFVGVGVGDDVMQSLPRDNDSEGLFSQGAVVHVKPFSAQQMTGLFQQMRPIYPFTESLQRELMLFSAGSPGVLSSLITFSVWEKK